MKRVKLSSILCMALILCLMISMAYAAAPAEDPVQPQFIKIVHLITDFTVSSSGYADCYSKVTLDNSSDTAELKMELQRSTDEKDWETIKDWSTSSKYSAKLDKGWYVLSGYYYRIHITANVYSSSGSLVDSATKDSDSVRY